MLVLLVLYIVLMPLFDDVVKGLLMWSPNLVEEKEVVKCPQGRQAILTTHPHPLMLSP